MKFPWLFVLVLATTAWAQPGNGSTPTIFSFRQELGLSAQQVEEMKQVVSDLLVSTKQQTRRIEQLDRDYVRLLQKEPPLEEAHAKLLEIERARTDWRYTDLKASYRLLEILTPDQKQKWRQLKAKKRATRPPADPPGRPESLCRQPTVAAQWWVRRM